MKNILIIIAILSLFFLAFKVWQEYKTKSLANAKIDYFSEFLKFNKKYGATYAQSFWIIEDDKEYVEDWLCYVSEEKVEEYSESLKVFAGADGTGAIYAFWFTNGNKDKNKAPIIFYGSEGEIHVVAQNIKELLQIISFGAEAYGFHHNFNEDEYDEEDYDYIKEFLEYKPNFLKFREWMSEMLKLEPVSIDGLKNAEYSESDEVLEIIENAQKKLKESFDAWQYQFYPNYEAKEAEERVVKMEKYKETKEKLLKEVLTNPSSKLYLKLADNEFSLDSDDIDEKVQDARIVFLEKALEFEPENIATLEDLASSYGQQNAVKSIRLYEKLLKLSKKPEKYYFDTADAYRDNEEYEKALDYYVKFLIKKPKKYTDFIQEDIVNTCEELKGKDAIVVLENTLVFGKNNSTLVAIYKLYFKRKQYAKAKEYVFKLMKNTQNESDSYRYIAERFLNKEAYAEAEEILIQNIKRSISNNEKMRSYNNIGLCNLRKKPQDATKAGDAFLEAYKLDNNEVSIQENLHTVGAIFAVNKEYEKAKEILKFCINNFETKKKENKQFLRIVEDKLKNN